MIYLFINYRSSHKSCSVKKDVLKNFASFRGKHLCQNLFFNKVAGLTENNFFKEYLRTTVSAIS